MSDHFHLAARDGQLKILSEATKRDANSIDEEDGATPTLVAAANGKLDALRILVGRGGDPDRCDYFGNTALHYAAAGGHLLCVTYLVNFGANVWSLDNDHHTAKDLAAMRGWDDILRFLDSAAAEQEHENPKSTKNKREKAERDMQKRRVEFEKLQEKAAKKMEIAQKRRDKELEKLRDPVGDVEKPSKGILASLSKTAGLVAKKKLESGGGGSTFAQPQRFSAHIEKERKFSLAKHLLTGGGSLQKQRRATLFSQTKLENPSDKSDFRISDHRQRTSVTLSGLRRNSEVLYVPKDTATTEADGRVPIKERGTLAGLFEESEDEGRRGSGGPFAGSSLFNRPGFGNVAFRKSIAVLPSNIDPAVEDATDESHSEDSSLDEEQPRLSIVLFLAANGLTEYTPMFAREKVDLEALMLLTDEEIERIGLPLGPRKKLRKAIEDRRSALEAPGDVVDSPLL